MKSSANRVPNYVSELEETVQNLHAEIEMHRKAYSGLIKSYRFLEIDHEELVKRYNALYADKVHDGIIILANSSLSRIAPIRSTVIASHQC